MDLYEKLKKFIMDELDVSGNPVQFPLKQLFNYDYQVLEYFCYNFKHISKRVNTVVMLKKRAIQKCDEVTINYIPCAQMPKYVHSNCNPDFLGKVFSLKGTVIGISDPVMTRLFVNKCDNPDCSQRNIDQFFEKQTSKCPYCNKRMNNLIIIRNVHVNLVINDENNNQVVCRTENKNDPDLNIVKQKDNILGTKAVMVVRLFEVNQGKECIFNLDIEGYSLSDFSKPTKKRLQRAISLIRKNKDNLIQMLITEIAPKHFKHFDIKKILLLCILSPKPLNICLYGDAGIGKSSLVLLFLEFIENSQFLTAQTSPSGAIVGIDTGGTENKLIIGKLPMANNSVVLIDEVNEQHQETKNALHHIMSEKKIVYSKIKSFTMDINVSLIFCGNATSPNGRFEADIPFYSQLNISYPFMSRCNMVIKIDSAGNMENLDEFGLYLLRKKKYDTKYTNQEIKDMIYVLRNQKEKQITESAYTRLLEGWVNIVKGINESSPDNKENMLTETNRMAGNLKNLTIAYSYTTLDKEVTENHVNDVLDLFQKLHIDPMQKNFGGFDQFRMNATKSDKYKRPTNDDERRMTILNHIKTFKEPVDIDEVIEQCIKLIDVSQAKCEKMIHQLEMADNISIIHGKVNPKWMKNVESEYVDNEPLNANVNVEEWLFKQMAIMGGITDLYEEVKMKIPDEKVFEQALKNLKQKQMITIDADKYNKLN